MSRKIPPVKPKKMVRILMGLGFYIHHQTGSHIHLRHPEKRHLRVVVPFHARFDLPPSIVNSILNQAEITREEFLNSLKKKK